MPVRRFANSLVARVIFVALVIAIIGTIIRFSMLSSSLRESLEKHISAHLQSDAVYVAGDIDEKIRLRRHFLETLARQLPRGLLAKPATLETWLAERHTLSPHFALGLSVVSAGGQGVIADYPQLPGRQQLDFNDADWFRIARDQATFAIGKPAVGRASGQGVIIMAAPVLDGNGRVLAVLCGTTTLDAPGFLNLVQNNVIGRTGGFLLISPRDKMFVTASRPELRLQPTPEPGVNLLHDQAMAGWRGTGITVNAAGIEELVAVAGVPSTGWFVVARMPTSEAFESVVKLRNLLLQRGSMIAGAILVILGIVLFRLFRPLREAAQQMHQMADGRVPLAPLAVVRPDEVGDMVDGFNFLVERIRKNEARMTELAHHDPLTGLPNRLSFQAWAEQMVALARRRQSRLALMFIDLDGFKPINDRHGHETGDWLLRQVAERLGEGLRQSDMVARFGGDEFIVLLTDAGERDEIALLGDKIIARLSEPYPSNEGALVIGASIGIAFLPDDAENIESLIAQADAAMYDAKRAGRNCCRFAHRPG